MVKEKLEIQIKKVRKGVQKETKRKSIERHFKRDSTCDLPSDRYEHNRFSKV